jgi:hypothetical protein
MVSEIIVEVLHIAGMSHTNRCVLKCTDTSMQKLSIMIADNRIPAGELDDMHVSQTNTMIQVAIQTPLDRRDGTTEPEATASAHGLKRHRGR